VTIARTTEVLHLEKVRFPVAIVFAEVNTRIQLLQGIQKGVIVPIGWDDRVGEVQWALRKWRNEILDLLTHEHRHGACGLNVIGKQIRLPLDHLVIEGLCVLAVHLQGRLDVGDNLAPRLPRGHRDFGQRAIPQ
jgi:hypothetical protein